MKGSRIIVSADPKGQFLEGTISGTPKPGTIMQLQAGTASISGRFTYEVYTPGADGKQRPIYILLADDLQGGLYNTAYVSGDRGFLYCPAAGEDFNLIAADIAGTADDITIGEYFIIQSGTGKLIAFTGTPDMTSFQSNEAVVDPVVDTYVWCTYTGH